MSHDRPFFGDTPRIIKELLKELLLRVLGILLLAFYLFLIIAFFSTGA